MHIFFYLYCNLTKPASTCAVPKGFELLSALSDKGKLLFSETQTTLYWTKNKKKKKKKFV